MAIKVDGTEVAGRGAPGLSAYRSAQLGGYTGTEEEFYAALGNPGSAGGLQMVLLWENASPTSEFGAQDIAVDLSGFQKVLIVCNSTTSDATQYPPGLCDVGSACEVSGLRGSGGAINNTYRISDNRVFTVAEDKITVASNSYNLQQQAWDVNDSANIPYRIYGIKGVTTNE